MDQCVTYRAVPEATQHKETRPMTEMKTRFPEIEVQLTGEDGNAFAILGWVAAALRRAGHSDAAIEFLHEAKSGDYDHLLQTAMRFVTCR